MGDKDELYDLENDPWEHYNLAEKENCSDKVLEMKSHLLNWMIETEDPQPVALPDSVGRPKILKMTLGNISIISPHRLLKIDWNQRS